MVPHGPVNVFILNLQRSTDWPTKQAFLHPLSNCGDKG